MRKHLDFTVNKQLCIGCGRCIKICPSGILALDKDYHSHMIERGDSLCSECEQCLAVCPRGAIHLLGKNPEDSFPPPSEYDASRITDALMVNNHSHKRFLSREVDPAMIEYFIDLLANASDERNSTKINYTIIKTAENVEHFSQLLFIRVIKEQHPLAYFIIFIIFILFYCFWYFYYYYF